MIRRKLVPFLLFVTVSLTFENCSSLDCASCVLSSTCFYCEGGCVFDICDYPLLYPDSCDCQPFSNCSSCALAPWCMWCPELEECLSIQAECLNSVHDPCGCFYDCDTCLSPMNDCAWCLGSGYGGSCLQHNLSSTSQETATNLVLQVESCSCLHYHDCVSCAAQPRCGWCGPQSQCFPLPPPNPCDGTNETPLLGGCGLPLQTSSEQCAFLELCTNSSDCVECEQRGCSWCASMPGQCQVPSTELFCDGVYIKDCSHAYCLDIPTCSQCVASQYDCVFCPDTDVCIPSDPLVRSAIGFRAECAQQYIDTSEECTISEQCSSHFSCEGCTSDPNCQLCGLAWCRTRGAKCVNGNIPLTDPQLCPYFAPCIAHADCSTCLSAGCAFCVTTETASCVPIANSSFSFNADCQEMHSPGGNDCCNEPITPLAIPSLVVYWVIVVPVTAKYFLGCRSDEKLYESSPTLGTHIWRRVCWWLCTSSFAGVVLCSCLFANLAYLNLSLETFFFSSVFYVLLFTFFQFLSACIALCSRKRGCASCCGSDDSFRYGYLYKALSMAVQVVSASILCSSWQRAAMLSMFAVDSFFIATTLYLPFRTLWNRRRLLQRSLRPRLLCAVYMLTYVLVGAIVVVLFFGCALYSERIRADQLAVLLVNNELQTSCGVELPVVNFGSGCAAKIDYSDCISWIASAAFLLGILVLLIISLNELRFLLSIVLDTQNAPDTSATNSCEILQYPLINLVDKETHFHRSLNADNLVASSPLVCLWTLTLLVVMVKILLLERLPHNFSLAVRVDYLKKSWTLVVAVILGVVAMLRAVALQFALAEKRIKNISSSAVNADISQSVTGVSDLGVTESLLHRLFRATGWSTFRSQIHDVSRSKAFFRCLVVWLPSWHGQRVFATFSCVFTASYFLFFLEVFIPQHLSSTTRLSPVTDASILIILFSVLGAILCVGGLILRSKREWKVIPIDDSCRLLVLVKSSMIVLKACVVSYLPSFGNVWAHVILISLFVLSNVAVLLVTCISLTKDFRNKLTVLRPTFYAWMYIFGLLWQQSAAVYMVYVSYYNRCRIDSAFLTVAFAFMLAVYSSNESAQFIKGQTDPNSRLLGAALSTEGVASINSLIYVYCLISFAVILTIVATTFALQNQTNPVTGNLWTDMAWLASLFVLSLLVVCSLAQRRKLEQK